MFNKYVNRQFGHLGLTTTIIIVIITIMMMMIMIIIIICDRYSL
jgi:hypothetical protein